VLEAGSDDAILAASALESLCRKYWYPTYAFVRRRGCAPPEAEDLTQAFFAHLLEREMLSMVVVRP
jgi:RNA polymerase sigma-70 factor (ECF subfamily)